MGLTNGFITVFLKKNKEHEQSTITEIINLPLKMHI